MKKFFVLPLLLSTVNVLAAVPIVDLAEGSSNSSVQTSAAPAQSIASSSNTVDALAPPSSLTDTSSSSSADVTNTGADMLAARQSLPLEQRVKLLEQQLNNLTQMNLPGKIDSLEQQIQQLTGQLEQQTHALQTLSTNTTANPAAQAPAANSLTAENKTDAQSTLADKIKATSNSSTSNTANTAKPAENSFIANAEAAVVQNTPIAKTAATQSMSSANATGGGEDKAYQAALDLLAKKKNVEAINAFNSFIKTYPSSSYVPNSHYWLGELYGMSNKNDLASKEFNTIIQNYPTNSKVPDAMLKLAIMHDDAGQHAQAKRELQKIIHDYPNTAAARLAKLRLGNQ